MSVKDPNAGNYHMVIPKVYKVPRYLNSLNSTGNVSILKSRVTSDAFSTDEGFKGLAETSCKNIKVCDKKRHLLSAVSPPDYIYSIL